MVAQLLPAKFLRLPAVLERCGHKRSTLYLAVAQGRFPKPVNIGERAVAWVESEIDAWIAARVAESRQAATAKDKP
jgi:prophage regulatory protein